MQKGKKTKTIWLLHAKFYQLKHKKIDKPKLYTNFQVFIAHRKLLLSKKDPLLHIKILCDEKSIKFGNLYTYLHNIHTTFSFLIRPKCQNVKLFS